MNICINKDPVLRKKSKELDIITDQDRVFINDMFDMMDKNNGIGLAAVQVGSLKQIITVDIGQGKICLINPRILKKHGPKKAMHEGCLSLPDITVNVWRHDGVIVEALDPLGNLVKIEATDLLARVLQHEIDHLSGKMIIDYLPWYKKMVFDLRKY